MYSMGNYLQTVVCQQALQCDTLLFVTMIVLFGVHLGHSIGNVLFIFICVTCNFVECRSRRKEAML